MRRQQIAFGLVVALGCYAASGVLAQRQPASVERGSIWNDPRMRERVYTRTLERQMTELTRAYELTDEQQGEVRQRLEALKLQQESYSARIEEEMGGLRDEMTDIWHQRQAGQAIDEQKYERAGRRLQELWQGAPLLNPRRVMDEVEKLLPADQARQGRERWEEAREVRLREWAERFADFRGGGGMPGGANAGDAWERFVEAFCREFELDAAQRATAQSVLRDVQGRRDRHLRTHAEEIEAAQHIEDGRFRRERIQQTLQPVAVLYGELRGRLDRIPTTAQIESVRRRAATQPADSDWTPEPAADGVGRARPDPATATRPSDMIRPQGPPPLRDLQFRREREAPLPQPLPPSQQPIHRP